MGTTICEQTYGKHWSELSLKREDVQIVRDEKSPCVSAVAEFFRDNKWLRDLPRRLCIYGREGQDYEIQAFSLNLNPCVVLMKVNEVGVGFHCLLLHTVPRPRVTRKSYKSAKVDRFLPEEDVVDLIGKHSSNIAEVISTLEKENETIHSPLLTVLIDRLSKQFNIRSPNRIRYGPGRVMVFDLEKGRHLRKKAQLRRHHHRDENWEEMYRDNRPTIEDSMVPLVSWDEDGSGEDVPEDEDWFAAR